MTEGINRTEELKYLVKGTAYSIEALGKKICREAYSLGNSDELLALNEEMRRLLSGLDKYCLEFKDLLKIIWNTSSSERKVIF